MQRKPLRSVISTFVAEEFYSSDLTMREFAKKYGLSLGNLQKLLSSDTKGFNINTVDNILNGFNVSLITILEKYGEYET
ncbi:helix-turn-helix domain-containing protein [Erysipelothrix rhusiopathiae]|nr:helix-turn-helix domain-containing protein [Erysipelothrix rhusiopathiae]MDE8269080.1 helix-turn-helix domain-containing protein [Erysipelothrix rhusiopathiae]MDE8270651.1 helix-turn-helix domain-containing protein [Erysipelothrix rhusiopathiae]MDE8279076.1 helix-turn-helix domain-containing protein [Erysipelothrix rhusiopathiae]MDE8319438.1 helix-turn-helix domain-containing protein [Erysipelothrix rhusiopathiae]